MLWVHLFLIILYMIAFLTATGLWNHQDSRQFAYCTLILTIHPSKSAPKLIFNIAPASKAVRYRKMSYDGELDGINQFRGEPRPEVDKVWHDLLENNNIRLKKAELRKMNRTAIYAPRRLRIFWPAKCLPSLTLPSICFFNCLRQSTANRATEILETGSPFGLLQYQYSRQRYSRR